MSILRDFLDTVKDIQAAGSEALDLTKKDRRYSSIAKRSMEGTLQFPTIVSKAIDIDTLQMVTKALERQYASFTQITLSMSPFLNLAQDKDAIGYLRRFHQNSNVKTGMGDFVSFVKENYEVSASEDGEQLMFTAIAEGSTYKLEKEHQSQLRSIYDDMNTEVLNEKFAPRTKIHNLGVNGISNYHNSIVTEARNGRKKSKREKEYEELRNIDLQQRINSGFRDSQNADLKKQELQNRVASGNRDLEIFGMRKKELENKIKLQGLDQTAKALQISKSELEAELTKQNLAGLLNPKNDYILPNELLKNNDARKANELIPTTMHVRTMLLNKDGVYQSTLDFLIGIKATMHPVSSDEIVTNLNNALKTNGKFFDFIRWSTGEISFVKDFLLNIKEMKDDVVSRSQGASHWWISLKRRSALARVRAAFGKSGQILPNASIVVSMDEVEYFRSKHGFDLMDVNSVEKIMGKYFLLGFVVVDNSSQIVHFLFDGQTDYQAVTFTGLERDNKSGGGSDIKDVLKLVQRV